MRARALLIRTTATALAAVSLAACTSSFSLGTTVDSNVEAAVAAHQGPWTEADLRAAPDGAGRVESAVPTADGGVLVVEISSSSRRNGTAGSRSSSRTYTTRCSEYTITGPTVSVRKYMDKGSLPSTSTC